MLVAYGKPLRKFLSKTGLRQILNFGDVQFFQEATTYVCIFVTEKSGPKEKVKVLSFNRKTYHGDFLTEVEEIYTILLPQDLAKTNGVFSPSTIRESWSK